MFDQINDFFFSIDWPKFGKAIILVFSVIVLLKVIEIVVIRRLKKIAEKTETQLDDMIVDILSSLGWFFYLLLALFITTRVFDIPKKIDVFASKAFLVISVYYVTKVLIVISDYGFRKVIEKQEENGDTYDASIFRIARTILRILIWIVAFLVVLQNFNFQVSALVGGLGILGLAFAFGIQSILEDLFSIFSIYIDKPFKVGDYIKVGEDMGTVDKIGIKSTRIKTFKGQELLISNKELTSARINNFRRMKTRAVVFKLAFAFDTPVEKLEKISDIIKKIIEKQENTEFLRVHFIEISESVFIFEVAYKLLDKDYTLHLNTKQAINFGIAKSMVKEKIEFAYPTRTVNLNNRK